MIRIGGISFDWYFFFLQEYSMYQTGMKSMCTRPYLMHRKRAGDEATSTTEIIRDEYQPALCVRGLPKMRD